MDFLKFSKKFISHYYSRDKSFLTFLNTFYKMANYCNVFVCAINRTIVPWTVVTVEPSMSFEDVFIEIK